MKTTPCLTTPCLTTPCLTTLCLITPCLTTLLLGLGYRIFGIVLVELMSYFLSLIKVCRLQQFSVCFFSVLKYLLLLVIIKLNTHGKRVSNTLYKQLLYELYFVEIEKILIIVIIIIIITIIARNFLYICSVYYCYNVRIKPKSTISLIIINLTLSTQK